MRVPRLVALAAETCLVAGLCIWPSADAGCEEAQTQVAQEPSGDPRQPAPNVPSLRFEEVLNAPAGDLAQLDDLRGKVVVIDFWETTCAPCIASFPHLKRLREQVRDVPVLFIAVTWEPRDVVERFLQKRDVPAWVALDRDESEFRRFGVKSVPTLVVIDTAGEVAAVIHPNDLTSEGLRNVAEGKPYPTAGSDKREGPVGAAPVTPFPEMSRDLDNGVYVVLRPANQPEAKPVALEAVTPSTHSATWVNVPLERIIFWLYGPSKHRKTFHDGCDREAVDLFAHVPADAPTPPDVLSQVTRAALPACGVDCRTVSRPRSVYLLELSGGTGKLVPTVSRGGARSYAPGQIVIVNGTVSTLASVLELGLDRPVVDETGAAGSFDFDLSWTAEDSASLAQALESGYGIVLRSAERPIEILEVSVRRKP